MNFDNPHLHFQPTAAQPARIIYEERDVEAMCAVHGITYDGTGKHPILRGFAIAAASLLLVGSAIYASMPHLKQAAETIKTGAFRSMSPAANPRYAPGGLNR